VLSFTARDTSKESASYVAVDTADMDKYAACRLYKKINLGSDGAVFVVDCWRRGLICCS
jgi:hypothetical protein